MCTCSQACESPYIRVRCVCVFVCVIQQTFTTQIQNMLEELGMTQYQEAFSREWIDGEVFKELDEVALRELGVTSRLDQIRLKKVISKGHV